MVGSAAGLSRGHTVSPMPTSGTPVKAQMSPASTRSAGTLLKLSYTNSSLILPVLGFKESAQTIACKLRLQLTPYSFHTLQPAYCDEAVMYKQAADFPIYV